MNSDPELERQYFTRGKELCGQNAGGLLAKLLKAKQRNIALARAALEMAATKQDAREYVGRIVQNGNGGYSAQEWWNLSREPAKRAALLFLDRSPPRYLVTDVQFEKFRDFNSGRTGQPEQWDQWWDTWCQNSVRRARRMAGWAP